MIDSGVESDISDGQAKAIAAIEPKLHSGPQAFQRFKKAMQVAVTVAKTDVDKAVQKEQAGRAKQRQAKKKQR